MEKKSQYGWEITLRIKLIHLTKGSDIDPLGVTAKFTINRKG